MDGHEDLWNEIGELSEEEIFQLMTRLYDIFDKKLAKDQDDPAAGEFFKQLALALELTGQCNLNRR